MSGEFSILFSPHEAHARFRYPIRFIFLFLKFKLYIFLFNSLVSCIYFLPFRFSFFRYNKCTALAISPLMDTRLSPNEPSRSILLRDKKKRQKKRGSSGTGAQLTRLTRTVQNRNVGSASVRTNTFFFYPSHSGTTSLVFSIQFISKWITVILLTDVHHLTIMKQNRIKWLSVCTSRRSA